MKSARDVFEKECWDNVIPFDELQAVGWTLEECIEYLSLIDEVRAAVICMDGWRNKDRKFENEDLAKRRARFITSAVTDLNSFLKEKLDCDILLPTSPEWFELTVYCPYISAGRIEDKAAIANKIPRSVDTLRLAIENKIYEILTTQSVLMVVEDKVKDISTEKLQLTLSEMQRKQAINQLPEYPIKETSYSVWQDWAKKYDTYDTVENQYDDIISVIKEEIENRAKMAANKMESEEHK